MYLFFSLNINITQSFSTILALLSNVGRTSCRALVSELVGVDVTIYGTSKCNAVLKEGFVLSLFALHLGMKTPRKHRAVIEIDMPELTVVCPMTLALTGSREDSLAGDCITVWNSNCIAFT